MGARDGLRIALTGGTGLLGRVVVPMLLERGHRVRCLVRPQPGRELPEREGLEWVSGRLDELEPLDELARDVDLILHMAYEPPAPSPVPGRSDVEHWVRTNYLASTRLLERTASTAGKQLIYVSTLAVYGKEPDRDPLGTDTTRASQIFCHRNPGSRCAGAAAGRRRVLPLHELVHRQGRPRALRRRRRCPDRRASERGPRGTGSRTRSIRCFG